MKYFLLLAALLLAGCMTTDNASAPADDPYPANYKQIIVKHKAELFVDPDSVRDASVSAPKRGSMPTSPTVESAPNIAAWRTPWIVCVRANARNRMGGYGGMSYFAILIVQGQLFGSRAGPSKDFGDLGAHWCQDHQQFEPFPELTKA